MSLSRRSWLVLIMTIAVLMTAGFTSVVVLRQRVIVTDAAHGVHAASSVATVPSVARPGASAVAVAPSLPSHAPETTAASTAVVGKPVSPSKPVSTADLAAALQRHMDTARRATSAASTQSQAARAKGEDPSVFAEVASPSDAAANGSDAPGAFVKPHNDLGQDFWRPKPPAAGRRPDAQPRIQHERVVKQPTGPG